MPHNFEEKKLPSVTQILKEMLPEPEGLKYWKKKNQNWEQILKEKGNVGTLIHYRILNKLSPVELEMPFWKTGDLPDNILSIIENAQEMWDSLNLEIEPILVEQFQKNDKYCGTLDLLGVIDGEVVLVDLKTGKNIYDNHLLQLGGYAGLCEEYPDKGMIIALHPFIETNPDLKIKMKKIDDKKLFKYTEQFNTLVAKWYEAEEYKRNNL